MKLGNTIVWCPPGTVKNHLWIVISDPSRHNGVCVVVNLTESSHGKFSHTLRVGQHRWIYKDSDVNYGDAFATTEAHLAAEIKSGKKRKIFYFFPGPGFLPFCLPQKKCSSGGNSR